MIITNCPRCGAMNATTTCTKCGWSQLTKSTVSTGARAVEWGEEMSEMKDRLLKFVETIREGALFFSYDVLDKKDYVRGRIECNGGQPVFFAGRIGLDIEELTELVEKIIELQKECQKEQEGA